jgi:hypothetical protein
VEIALRTIRRFGPGQADACEAELIARVARRWRAPTCRGG